MNKFKSILLSLLMLFTFLATPSFANAASNESVTYFDDGSYMVTTIIEEPTLQKPSGMQTNATSTTKTMCKQVNYYNGSNQVMWYVIATGTFTYNGTTAKCNSSSVKAESLVSTWKMSKLSSARSGATAYAAATAKHYMAGLVINTIDELVSLTCSPSGKFS